MKRIIALILAVSTLILILTSCDLFGDLNGTYISKENYLGYNYTYKFSGTRVIYSFAGKSIKGNYKIEEDKLKIKWDISTFEDSYDFEINGDTIIIGGEEYVKK
jgi:uncharacterized lipoprotein NlpE involved in copper resistance